ncbi:CocE/NonD family hydrolase, partial [Chloroflexota bacterium]
ISQPKYGVKLDKDVMVAMRDGVRVCIDVFRPDTDGKFPVLIAQSGYGKELQELPMPPQAQGSPLWDGDIEAGDSEYFVSRGYVHIITDARGCGYSEGEYNFLFSKDELMDVYELIEWAAKQPWCNGNVGLVGMSYFGAIQPRVAILQPPHLKAICPIAPDWDAYRDINYNGGIMGAFFYGLWDGRSGDSGWGQRNAVPATKRACSPEEYQRKIDEILKDPDIQKFPNFFHLLKYPQKNPIFMDILLNPLDNQFWKERACMYEAAKINIPTFLIGSWKRSYWASAAFGLYNKISSKDKKVLIDPDGWWDRPWKDYYEENIRWFDHWLKGNDTGYMDEPPINMFVGGLNEFRFENEWPLARMKPTKYYLHPFGKLSTEPERYTEEPDPFIQPPLYVTHDVHKLIYQTAPFSRDFEVTGPLALYLYASIDQDDTNWIIKLFDSSDKGDQQLGRGYLKASHRALDESQSTPLDPFHPHTSKEPVVPGKIYLYTIGIQPIGHVFRGGHRLKLEIRSMEHCNEGAQGQPPHTVHLCSSRTTLHNIYRNKEYQSHLLLPIIPR